MVSVVHEEVNPVVRTGKVTGHNLMPVPANPLKFVVIYLNIVRHLRHKNIYAACILTQWQKLLLVGV